jgi:hypothetical protein
MRCDFCGEEIESTPFQKDGMDFCSLECSDAMETGESIPLGEDVLDDPDELEDDEDEKNEAEDDDDQSFDEEFIDDSILDNDSRIL